MSNNENVQWTAKLPALVIGVLLLIAGAFASARRATAAAIILIALGLAFVGYSLTIKDWCELKGTTYGQSAWGNGFGGGFGACLKAKGWFSF